MKRILIIICCFFWGCASNQTDKHLVLNSKGLLKKNIFASGAPANLNFKIPDEYKYMGSDKFTKHVGAATFINNYNVFAKFVKEKDAASSMVIIYEGKINEDYIYTGVFCDRRKVFYKDKIMLKGIKYKTTLFMDIMPNDWVSLFPEKHTFAPSYIAGIGTGRILGADKNRIIIVYYLENLEFWCDGKYGHHTYWDKEILFNDEQKKALEEFEKRARKTIQFR